VNAEGAGLTDEAGLDGVRGEAGLPPIEQQDSDFHAWLIRPSFEIQNAERDGGDIDASIDPAQWDLSDDEAANARLIAGLKAEVVEALDPWCSHFLSLGFLRADRICAFAAGGEPGDDFGDPVFYLVHRAADASLAPQALGAFEEVSRGSAAVPDARLVVRPDVLPTNTTMLYEASRRSDLSIGQWGGEATPELAPRPDETREAWLARVCMPSDRIARAVTRWERCGGDLDLYGYFGAADERAAGDQPIEWIVPGLIPRGYVTLLVGTKMAGKSTLLGEMMAVVDSECQTSRSVLGIEVEARGVGGIVSGEDGDNIINRRAEFYEPVHGTAQGLVIDLATRPWAEALKLLHRVPKLDFLGIDPLRAILPGDEDASGNISPLFDDLNALARLKNCAIVLVHHLSKSTPQSLSAMLKAVRGSGAITDRPRMVIGMLDRGAGVTEVGIIKHNIPPSEELWSEVNVGRRFRRDADTLTLVPAEAGPPRRDVAAAAGALGSIMEAVGHYNRLNVTLRRTGKCELFELKAPQLLSVSRSVIREGVTTLLAAGRLLDGAQGLRLAEDQISPAATEA
jgi:hypothetical protein